MGRLIIGYVLPGDAETIDRVVHEGAESVPGWNCGGEDAQFFVVASSGDDFLPPITEYIGAKDRVGFRSVVGNTVEIAGGKQIGFDGSIVVPLRDRHAIEQFAQQIAIPPDAHVAGARRIA